MRLILSTFLCFSLCAHSAASGTDISLQMITTEREQGVMIDFTQQQEVDNWRISNDSVMGGLSKGTILFAQDHGVFTGTISLDNNGGFSSVFRAVEPLAHGLDTVIIDIEGDGQTYQLRMVVNVDGSRLAYKHDFDTIVGQRETLKFSLADFQARFRGRKITNAPALKSEDIREAGFLLTKKVAGKFSLSVFHLMFLNEKQEDGPEDKSDE